MQCASTLLSSSIRFYPLRRILRGPTPLLQRVRPYLQRLGRSQYRRHVCHRHRGKDSPISSSHLSHGKCPSAGVLRSRCMFRVRFHFCHQCTKVTIRSDKIIAVQRYGDVPELYFVVLYSTAVRAFSPPPRRKLPAVAGLAIKPPVRFWFSWYPLSLLDCRGSPNVGRRTPF